METKENRSYKFKVFLKSMFFTAAAIMLILIGYFTAYYLFGAVA